MTCTDRSFHPFTGTGGAALDHEHVQDPDLFNNAATSGEDVVEVFEAVDLVIEPLRIACGEREDSTVPATCAVTASVRNDGPATAVATLTEITLAGPDDCVLEPVAPQAFAATLDADAAAVFAATWDVVCTSGLRHVFDATAEIRAAEPHAEDLAQDNNWAEVRWLPTDAKPRSLPSSINISKQGAAPFAVLSTPALDAVAEVDRDSLGSDRVRRQRVGLCGTG